MNHLQVNKTPKKKCIHDDLCITLHTASLSCFVLFHPILLADMNFHCLYFFRTKMNALFQLLATLQGTNIKGKSSNFNSKLRDCMVKIASAISLSQVISFLGGTNTEIVRRMLNRDPKAWILIAAWQCITSLCNVLHMIFSSYGPTDNSNHTTEEWLAVL